MRRLIIITNNGGEGNYLPGVAIDKQNYLDFFRQPEGGGWQAGEIQRYANTCSLAVLRAYLLDPRKKGTIDYVVIVFCGHGYTNRYGQLMFELSPGNEASLEQIKSLVSMTRCLMIADSCSSVVLLEQGGVLPKPRERLFSRSQVLAQYAAECRRIYDEKFMAMTVGSFCIGKAATTCQASNETDTAGGRYSYELLLAARNAIQQKKGIRLSGSGHEPVSCFPFIHSIARDAVSRKTKGEQTPECQTSRGNQPPFVVVP